MDVKKNWRYVAARHLPLSFKKLIKRLRERPVKIPERAPILENAAPIDVTRYAH